MNGLVLLAFVALIAPLLLNPVEAGKCYKCTDQVEEQSCEHFRLASDCEKKYQEQRFTIDSDIHPDADCSKCMTVTNKDGEFIQLSCLQEITTDDLEEGKKLDLCEGDLCNAPVGGTESLEPSAKCYNCDPKLHRIGLTCEDFEKASEEEKKCKFISKGTEQPTFSDCKKCMTLSENGKVTSRSCAPNGLSPNAKEVGEEKLSLCEGDFCNGAGSSESGTSVKCYACGERPFRICEQFDRASAEEKKRSFTITEPNNPYTNAGRPCKKCVTVTYKGQIFTRGCSSDVDEPKYEAGEFKTEVCESDFCNGPKASSGKCYACGPPQLGLGSCKEFESASAEERKRKFTIDSNTHWPFDLPLDCSRCSTTTFNGEVTLRLCLHQGEEFCEGDLCNGPTDGYNRYGSGERCYLCAEGEPKLPSCSDFENASPETRKRRFIMDSKTPSLIPLDCTKCSTQKKNGRVTSRACNPEGFEICKGELCNGKNLNLKIEKKSSESAGNLKSWTTLAVFATAASLLKGSLV